MPIATKLGRVVTYIDRLLLIKSHCSWLTLSCKITWQIKNIISSLPLCLLPPIPTECWLTIHNVTWSFKLVVTWGHAKNWIYYVSHIPTPIVTKLVRMVIYYYEFQPIGSLRMWFCEVTWKIEYITSPFAEEQWEQN